jgi:hypothetical protein
VTAAVASSPSEPGADWERFVAAHFPAYLLPAAHRQAISRATAEQFLSRFGGSETDLELVCAASLFSDASKIGVLVELAEKLLPSLAAQLPAVTEVHRREWEGGFRGRLDLPATLALHRAGKQTRYVTRDRRRRFDLPETLLVRAVVDRLCRLLRRLSRTGVIDARGWGARLLDVEQRLGSTVVKSSLRDIPVVPVERSSLDAATRARHPAYAACAAWQSWLAGALDHADTRALHLAAGALVALNAEQRFQVAVLLRLLQSIQSEVERREPDLWELQYTAITEGRKDVAALVREDGAAIRFHYDQAVLSSGPRDALVAHHLASTGRARPDVTIVFHRPDSSWSALVVEAKQSTDRRYLVKGIEEAIVYHHEYEGRLVDWPRVIVVAEGGFVGQPRRQDDVIALNWLDLVPERVCRSLVDEIPGPAQRAFSPRRM